MICFVFEEEAYINETERAKKDVEALKGKESSYIYKEKVKRVEQGERYTAGLTASAKQYEKQIAAAVSKRQPMWRLFLSWGKIIGSNVWIRK